MKRTAGAIGSCYWGTCKTVIALVSSDFGTEENKNRAGAGCSGLRLFLCEMSIMSITFTFYPLVDKMLGE